MDWPAGKSLPILVETLLRREQHGLYCFSEHNFFQVSDQEPLFFFFSRKHIETPVPKTVVWNTLTLKCLLSMSVLQCSRNAPDLIFRLKKTHCSSPRRRRRQRCFSRLSFSHQNSGPESATRSQPSTAGPRLPVPAPVPTAHCGPPFRDALIPWNHQPTQRSPLSCF